MNCKPAKGRPLAGAGGEEVYASALELLARQAFSAGLLAARLRRQGAGEEETAAALARLQEAGLLDDQAYAQRLYELWLAKGRTGKGALEAELARKLVPASLAARLLAAVPPEAEEEAAARALAAFWQRQEGRLQAIQGLPAGRQRSTAVQKLAAAAGRYLAARGFQAQAMEKVWEKLGNLLVFFEI